MKFEKGMFNHVLDTWSGDKESKVGTGMLHAALGLISEVGEFTDKIKKKAFKDGYEVGKEIFVDELGDIGYYWAVMCYELGLDPVEVMSRNKEKLSGGKHGWPDKKK